MDANTEISENHINNEGDEINCEAESSRNGVKSNFQLLYVYSFMSSHLKTNEVKNFQ